MEKFHWLVIEVFGGNEKSFDGKEVCGKITQILKG